MEVETGAEGLYVRFCRLLLDSIKGFKKEQKLRLQIGHASLNMVLLWNELWRKVLYQLGMLKAFLGLLISTIRGFSIVLLYQLWYAGLLSLLLLFCCHKTASQPGSKMQEEQEGGEIRSIELV